MIPFALIGSERTVAVNGKAVRARRTKSGVINSKRKFQP
jgi:septin family protein